MFMSVEVLCKNVQSLTSLLVNMGMEKVYRNHYKLGHFTFIVNENPLGIAQDYFEKHGPSAFSVGLALPDLEPLLNQKDLPVISLAHHPLGYTHMVPWIGGTQLYIVEKKVNMPFLEKSMGLDHISYNVCPSEFSLWTRYFNNILGFKPIEIFHIEGRLTHLQSQAFTSSCGTMRITLNSSSDPQSQIQEFLRCHKGSGIQHIAFSCHDILKTTSAYLKKGFPFLEIDPAYYDQDLPQAFRSQKEKLKENHIIVEEEGGKMLRQAFSYPILGKMFFELIERQGHFGFGKRNFKAAFTAFEEDQQRRGVL